ncbi:MAG: IS200/IS605 family transposase [Candidatus Omnitrophota bacterium]|jgi:REP element-mobilizing transposase RayT|nr:MAG: IS200/IS605 family transposase [Candidatus Omnitrophota bacterium]
MPQSLSCVIIHIIFSTKDRYPFINDAIETDLYSYLAAILQQVKCPAILINGMPDHVHILCNLSRTISIAKLLEEVKKSSSKWIKTKGGIHQKFHWQAGYGVFSVSQTKVQSVKTYIQNQKDHHRTKTFQDEFREFLSANGVDYDEKYVWD